MDTSFAYRIARDLMEQHGLKHWSFMWDYSVRRFGCCRPTRIGKEVMYGTISMSMHLTRLNTEERFRRTVLHEIAHALAADESIRAGHGPIWKKHAVALGILPIRCYSTSDTVVPALKYIGSCPNGHEAERMKLPRAPRKLSCGKCCPRYDERFLLTFRINPAY